MIDLLNSKQKVIANITSGYTELIVCVDNAGHVLLNQDDDYIWLDEKSLGELIGVLQKIKEQSK
nr:MAG TPA: hypothetical protein [Caudoviricetes sp.]